MATWNDLLRRISSEGHDPVRREMIKHLSDYTGRNTIIYVSDFLQPHKGKPVEPSLLDLSDKIGFQEVIESLDDSDLDVLIESPGGSPEAAESIVTMLRSKFSNVRFIVPNVAKSAGTILALSGDIILMDDKSELGPTDPQMILRREGRTFQAPAQAIIAQFDKATREIGNNPSLLPSWIPILTQYGPSLLQECENAITMTKTLVRGWLENYMFRGETGAQDIAQKISDRLASEDYLSHRRAVGIDEAKRLGVKVFDLRENRVLQKLVWDLYLSIHITFDQTTAVKIFENQKGDAYISHVVLPPGIIVTPGPGQPPTAPTLRTPDKSPPSPTVSGNRQERRRKKRR